MQSTVTEAFIKFKKTVFKIIKRSPRNHLGKPGERSRPNCKKRKTHSNAEGTGDQRVQPHIS